MSDKPRNWKSYHKVKQKTRKSYVLLCPLSCSQFNAWPSLDLLLVGTSKDLTFRRCTGPVILPSQFVPCQSPLADPYTCQFFTFCHNISHPLTGATVTRKEMLFTSPVYVIAAQCIYNMALYWKEKFPKTQTYALRWYSNTVLCCRLLISLLFFQRYCWSIYKLDWNHCLFLQQIEIL